MTMTQIEWHKMTPWHKLNDTKQHNILSLHVDQYTSVRRVTTRIRAEHAVTGTGSYAHHAIHTTSVQKQI